MKVAVAAGAFALAMINAVPASAADCAPKLQAALDMEVVHGGIAIPVAIGGGLHKMLIKTDEAHSMVNAGFAADAGFETKPVGPRVTIEVNQALVSNYAIVPTLGIGPNNGANIAMLIEPTGVPVRDDVVGSIGMDLLTNFDLDLDFKNNKLNLFASNACDGGGVYWSKTYAELPLDMSTARANSEMTLDGKTVSVTFATGTNNSYMRANVAKALFNITAAGGPQDMPTAEVTDAERSRPAGYFKALDGGGLNIANPQVSLFGDPNAPLCDGRKHTKFFGSGIGATLSTRCYSNGQLTLGLHELRRLHLYFAFKAEKVYFTGADAN